MLQQAAQKALPPAGPSAVGLVVQQAAKQALGLQGVWGTSAQAHRQGVWVWHQMMHGLVLRIHWMNSLLQAHLTKNRIRLGAVSHQEGHLLHPHQI